MPNSIHETSSRVVQERFERDVLKATSIGSSIARSRVFERALSGTIKVFADPPHNASSFYNKVLLLLSALLGGHFEPAKIKPCPEPYKVQTTANRIVVV